MNKQTYIQPNITVVSFVVERGMIGSNEEPQSVLHSMTRRDSDDSYYTGDERFGEHIGDGGHFSTGSWL